MDCSACEVRTTIAKISIGVLVERVVDSAGQISSSSAAFADVVDDADDLTHGFGREARVADLFADGVFAGKVFAGEGLVDDEDLRLGRVFIVGEEAAADEFGLEVLRSSPELTSRSFTSLCSPL